MTNESLALRLAGALALSLIVACSSPGERKTRHFDKGNAHFASASYREAILEYRNAIRIDPRFGEARFKLAEAYDKTGNEQAAREYLRAGELLPDRADVQVKVAGLMLAGKQYEQTIKHADLALKADPTLVDAQLLRAYALAGLKDVDGAVAELEKVTSSAPGDYRPYTSLGALAASHGRKEEAEAAFRKAVASDPSSAEPKVALAYFLWSTKRAADAEKTLLEAIQNDPANNRGNRLLALFYIANARLNEAEAPLKRLVDAKQDRAALLLGDLYLNTDREALARPLYESLKTERGSTDVAVSRLATIDYRAGRRDEALAVLDAQLQNTPKSVALLALKARWLLAAGRNNDALQTAQKAVDAAPESPEAHFVLGMSHAANQDPQAAINAYNEVLRLSPAMAAAQIELSRLLLARGEKDKALQHAEAARKAAPANPIARYSVARALLNKGDLRAAESEIAGLAKQYPDSAPVHALYGQVLMARSNLAEAAGKFDKALALDSAEPTALLGRMMVDVRQKRQPDARARLERALAAAPSNAAVLMIAAQFERSVGAPDAAAAHLRKAIEIDPANLEAYGALAGVYLSQKRLDDGKRELEEIVRRRPKAVGPRTMIGTIQQLQGRVDEAAKTFDAIVQETSKAPVAANNLAYIYAERGERLDEALQLAQTAKQQLPENPDVSDTLGWVYYKKGMAELAVRPLEFSVEKNPKNPLYLLHLGLAYAKTGETEKAKRMLNQALALKADVEGAAEARAVLASIQN